MGMVKEFKEFIMRGNVVVNMAVGLIIGASFGKIVTSLVNDVMMPPIGYLMKGVNFSTLFLNLKPDSKLNFDEAKKAGEPVIGYGSFLNELIGFLITAVCVFMVIKVMNAMKRRHEAAPAAPPALPKQEVLLEEIRDLLKSRQ